MVEEYNDLQELDGGPRTDKATMHQEGIALEGVVGCRSNNSDSATPSEHQRVNTIPTR